MTWTFQALHMLTYVGSLVHRVIYVLLSSNHVMSYG